MFGALFLKDNVENIFNVFGICDTIFNPVLTVNDLGISYRTINSWETSGLMLTERISNRNWHKFSFVDFIWLNIVFELRQLGFPLTKIKSLKGFLSEVVDEKILFEIKRREARISLDHAPLNRLVLLLAEIMYNKNHIALLCNKQGGFYIYNEQHVKEDRSSIDLGQLQFNNFVSISLTGIIIRYLSNTKLEVIEHTGLVSGSFLDILRQFGQRTIQKMVFELSDESCVQIDVGLFNLYEEFRNAGIHLLLTLKFEQVSVNE